MEKVRHRATYLMPSDAVGAEYHGLYWPSLTANKPPDRRAIRMIGNARLVMAKKILAAYESHLKKTNPLKNKTIILRELMRVVGDLDKDGYLDVSFDNIVAILNRYNLPFEITKLKKVILDRTTGFVRYFDDLSDMGRGNPQTLEYIKRYGLPWNGSGALSKKFADASKLDQKIIELGKSRFMEGRLECFTLIDRLLPTLKSMGVDLVENYNNVDTLQRVVQFLTHLRNYMKAVARHPYPVADDSQKKLLAVFEIGSLSDRKSIIRAIGMIGRMLEEFNSAYFVQIFPEAMRTVNCIKVFSRFRFNWQSDGYDIDRVKRIIKKISQKNDPKAVAKFLRSYLFFYYEHNSYPPVNYNFKISMQTLKQLSISATGFLLIGKKRITCGTFAQLAADLLKAAGYRPFFANRYWIDANRGAGQLQAHSVLVAAKTPVEECVEYLRRAGWEKRRLDEVFVRDGQRYIAWKKGVDWEVMYNELGKHKWDEFKRLWDSSKNYPSHVIIVDNESVYLHMAGNLTRRNLVRIAKAVFKIFFRYAKSRDYFISERMFVGDSLIAVFNQYLKEKRRVGFYLTYSAILSRLQSVQEALSSGRQDIAIVLLNMAHQILGLLEWSLSKGVKKGNGLHVGSLYIDSRKKAKIFIAMMEKKINELRKKGIEEQRKKGERDRIRKLIDESPLLSQGRNL